MEKGIIQKMKRNKKHSLIFKIAFISLLLNISCPLFADDTTPAPYTNSEFPTFMQDLRRFEIITLGSLPFVTLDTSLAYSTLRYAQHDYDAKYMPSLLGTSTYDSDEQIGIVLTSLGISVGIGITDLVIHLIKRSNTRKRQIRSLKNDSVQINRISEDPDAIKINIPDIEIIEDDN